MAANIECLNLPYNVNTIVEGFTATSLYKNMGKPNYTPTKENHQLLTVNVA